MDKRKKESWVVMTEEIILVECEQEVVGVKTDRGRHSQDTNEKKKKKRKQSVKSACNFHQSRGFQHHQSEIKPEFKSSPIFISLFRNTLIFHFYTTFHVSFTLKQVSFSRQFHLNTSFRYTLGFNSIQRFPHSTTSLDQVSLSV